MTKMSTSFRLPALVVSAIVLVASPSLAQEPPAASKQHQVLKMDAGTWDAELTTWPAGEGSEPVTFKCVENNRMMGDLWLISEFEGDMFGTKFSGRGQFGYDPLKESYVGTWIDSMTPTLSVMRGEYDAAKKTMTMQGKMFDPEQQREIESKNVTKYVDDDTRHMEMFMKDGDKWVKSMIVNYKRRK